MNSRFLFSNGELIEMSGEHVSAHSLYGTGVFTTLAVYEGQVFLWEKHWRRIVDNATRIGIDLSEFPETRVLAAIEELIRANGVVDGRVRISFFDESASRLWSSDPTIRTSLLIVSGERKNVESEFSITASPYALNTSSPLAGIKSCNYLEKFLALNEGKDRGFDECIQLNERGEVASASMANIFWVRKGKLFTPSLKTGCLAGTTREFILENVECEETEAGLSELRSADDIFLTSAGIGVVQVTEFDGQHLNGESHPINDLLPGRG